MTYTLLMSKNFAILVGGSRLHQKKVEGHLVKWVTPMRLELLWPPYGNGNSCCHKNEQPKGQQGGFHPEISKHKALPRCV